MILKAVLLALCMLASGFGALQAAVALESYILLGVGLLLAGAGVLRITTTPQPITG